MASLKRNQDMIRVLFWFCCHRNQAVIVWTMNYLPTEESKRFKHIHLMQAECYDMQKPVCRQKHTGNTASLRHYLKLYKNLFTLKNNFRYASNVPTVDSSMCCHPAYRFPLPVVHTKTSWCSLCTRMIRIAPTV